MIDAIVVYDVRTGSAEGERRLRAVAKLCEGIGTRVQYSVFELHCEVAQLIKFQRQLEATIVAEDSIRIYKVPAGVLDRVVQLGVERQVQPPGAQIW